MGRKVVPNHPRGYNDCHALESQGHGFACARYIIVRAEDIPVLARLAGRPLREVGTWPVETEGGIVTTIAAISP